MARGGPEGRAPGASDAGGLGAFGGDGLLEGVAAGGWLAFDGSGGDDRAAWGGRGGVALVRGGDGGAEPAP